MALDLLATYEDLLARNPELSAAQELADVILRDVSAGVRLYTGQEITAGTTTAVVPVGRDGRVLLPQRPVTALTAVENPVTGDPVAFVWDGVSAFAQCYRPGPIVDPFSGALMPAGSTTVRVTYDHGGEVPDDVIAVVCQIAARALGRPATEAGITQETIAGYSVQIGSAAGAGPLGMLPAEAAVLDKRYGKRVGTIWLSLP